MTSPNKFIAWMDEYVEEYLRLEPRRLKEGGR